MNEVAGASPDRKKVVGVGNALVDLLIHESDRFVAATGYAKGGMNLVDHEFIQQTLGKTDRRPEVVSGGSACNTIIGVGNLGGETSFVGKCGTGSYGRIFIDDLVKHNVQPQIFRSQIHTGRALSIITPDAQRSMFTYLGAAAELQPRDITPAHFQNAAVVYIEGYLLFNEDLITAALTCARQAGAQVALDLASYTVVEAARGLLKRYVADYVDILIANEDEARAYTGIADERRAIESMAAEASIAVLKVGRKGSYVAGAGKIHQVAAEGTGAAVDTTGAGDLWAAGFLYGLVTGESLQRSGALGSLCGYEVCQVVGANIDEAGWQRIRQAFGLPQK